jgi:branched-chain amino acid transport system permease protein
MTTLYQKQMWQLALVSVIVAITPFLVATSRATEILIFSIVAMAANLLIGYGGLYTFGQAIFFGIGAYVGGYLLAEYSLPWILPLLAGLVAGGAAAAIVAVICIRRSGLYFIMLTFALNQLVYYLAYSWTSVTGGEDGLVGIFRPEIGIFGWNASLDDPLVFYIAVALLFLLSSFLMITIINSPFGRIVQAIRDQPRRATSIGYNIRKAQILLFVISGAFTGFAGYMYSMLYWIVPISNVHWLLSGYIVFMVLIGGRGTMFGPAIGAAIFIYLQDYFSTFWSRWPLLFGLIVVFVVSFLQGGAIDLFHKAGNYIRHAINWWKGRAPALPESGSAESRQDP